MTGTPCGLPHYDYPESTCTQPAGHRGAHAAPLIIDGRDRGAVAWDGHDQERRMTGPTPADTLRAAANRLTQPGARILVTPRLIQPLADWLTAEALTWAGDEVHAECSPGTCTLDAALTAARILLAGQAPQDGPERPHEPAPTVTKEP